MVQGVRATDRRMLAGLGRRGQPALTGLYSLSKHCWAAIRSTELGLRVINIIALLLAVAWLARSPDWEPAITALGLLGTLIFQEARAATGAKGKSPFDHVYSTNKARDFYNAVAKSYDARNSTFLLHTHREVIRRIKEYVKDRDGWHVLDLGGGTGQLIASHFYDNQRGEWTSVDSSPNMVAQFQHNMQGVKLTTGVVLRDIFEFLADVRHPKKYDVVLIVLVLSSLPHDADWAKVAKLVKPGGALIVADIEPSYTAIHPHFTVLVEGRSHALRMRPTHLSELIPMITQSGLTQAGTQSVKQEQTNYSFVSVFNKPSSQH